VRRWTILVVPHDTDHPRSYAISERTLRRAVATAAVLVVVAVGGIGATAYQVARGRGTGWGELATESASASADTPAVDSLRATVESLHSALDTIRETEARLAQAAGVAPVDSATLARRAAIAATRASADSLLRGATVVAGRLGALADSARRRGVVPANGPGESTRPTPARQGRQD
jgi:hypothetical protein